MNLYAIIALSFALSLHVFSIGIKSGIFRCQSTIEWLRTSFFFTLFQVLLFTIGWFAASGIAPMIKSLSQPLGIVLLILLGFKIIINSVDPRSNPTVFNVSNIRILAILSLASAINAFLVGMAIALVNIELLPMLYYIASLSFILSISGILVGKTIGKLKMSIRADIFGGTIVVIIGVYFLLVFLGYLNLN